jgi:hypothetical protein
MQIDDKVWFNSEIKFKGICAEVLTPQPELHNTLLLAHFPATLARLERYLQAAAIEFRQYSTSDDSSLCLIDGRVVTGLARSLQTDRPQLGNPFLRKLQIIVAEHHPIFARDNHVIEVSERLHCQPEVCFHIGLDDPLLKSFGGEKLVELMKRLGVDESESISHQLVTSAIRNSQKKIEKKVPRDLQAESIEDWVKYNLKDGWN